MSKGALKKAAKAGSTISQKYAPAFLISNIIFFILRGWAWYLLLVIPGYAAFSFIPGFFKSSPKPSTNAVDTGGEENDENSKKMKASDRLRLQRMKKH
eukprot:gene4053-8060_t